ncbi:MAG: hypothetical protein HC905_32415 [Bacteroidales bacterium]|nr:hypothetical protein [Bacteroidales bacterium]
MVNKTANAVFSSRPARPRFLKISLDTQRCCFVNNKTHIAFVDSHTKSIGTYNYPGFSVFPLILLFMANLIV